MWKALKAELKGIFKQSKFHIIRYIGILFIPLLYGFVYVFAFWDPFVNVDQLPIAIVTAQKADGTKDHLGDAFGKAFSKSQHLTFGDMDVTLKGTHIYKDTTDKDVVKDVKNNLSKDYNATLVLPALDDVFNPLLESLADKSKSFSDQVTALAALISSLESSDITKNIMLINNKGKNYIISFGIEAGLKLGGKDTIIFLLLSALDQTEYQDYLVKDLKIDPVFLGGLKAELERTYNYTQNGGLHIKSEISQMHEHAKYGFGLAPFFMSVACWIGVMIASLIIHPKVYDRKVGRIKRYFAKMILIMFTSMIQMTILMGSLVGIGMWQLDVGNIFTMFMSLVFSGFIFATIIQAIRWAMPTRMLGIFTTIILLILQMTSNGGLFPNILQTQFYKVLNFILPASKTVSSLRESMFETNWPTLLEHLGILLIYPAIFIPIGLHFNKRKNGLWMNKSEGAIEERMLAKESEVK